jgi:2-polyprenyl-3-methyl-5-hydroxy-6-metoxy-1,4-benzoquinol methylase
MEILEMDHDVAQPFAFLDARESRFPLAVGAFRALLQIQAAFEAVVTAARWHDDHFWSDAEARCHEILHLCDQDQSKYSAAVEEWVKFSIEFLVKQRKFLKSGHYASESFETVRADLYDDDEKMKNFYLIALMFSFLFSSNYAGFFSFFRRRMLPRVEHARLVCDVGCGHGVYLTQMLGTSPTANGVGVDISMGSLQTARRLLSFHKVDPARYRLSQGDVQERLPLDDASVDAITCFEVIEHLERPAAAIAELRRILRPGGALCMSTAIRMESVDHIHLFRTPEEVRQLVEAGGLTIIEDQIIPLSTENLGDLEVVNRLVQDPNTPLGIVMLAS